MAASKPAHVADRDVEIWFQDEARVGQMGTQTRIWTRRGLRDRIPKQGGHQSLFIFGAACAATGIGACLVSPTVNTAAMNIFLQLLSAQISPGKHAILVLDRASWHRSRALRIPKNISLILLPPYSPELNPVEQVWQQLRARFWANRSYEDISDIAQALYSAWNSFFSKPSSIASLCSRKWTKFNL